MSDLDEAIELHRAALLLHPPGHSDRSSSLNNLAISLGSRFEQRGIMSDLDEAIELHRAALLLYPPGHSDRSSSLNNLARGIMSDLDEAIELHRAALLLRPPGHSDRSSSLNNLARGIMSDLDEAIELHRAALLLHPPGHSDRSSLGSRFEQRGIMSDLDEAIELHRAALLLHPPGHSDRSSLGSRFEQRGIMSDLDEAIELHRAALLLYPPGHSLRSSSLNNLARGIMSDLDEAIELLRTALLLYPPGHSDRSSSLNNLARGTMSDLDESIELHQAALLLYPPGHSHRSILHGRFKQRGIMSDLDEAIELHRAALLLRPPGRSLRSSLGSRFEQRGIMSDLDEAIELHRAALLLRPPGHSDRSSLRSRFEQRGIMSDLDEAIELHRAALLLHPPGHSDRSFLGSRFEQRGIMSDLDEAIELHRAALLLYPPGHSHRSILHGRFKQRGIMSDLDEAIELHRAALLLRPPGHSDRSSLRSRFEQRGIMSDLDEAIELHRAALLLRPPGHSHRSSLHGRFKQRGIILYLQLSCLSNAASRTDLTSADTLNHDSALLAYKTALKFLDQRVALLSSSSHHFDVIREAVSSLATDAFSCSVRHGALMTAVELVEQGRAVFWTQLARFSTPLDELSVSSHTGTALAEEFKRLSFRLHNVFDQSTGDQSPQIRQLTMQWDDIVSRIRMLHGFSRFLLPPLFSDLQKAAEDGPVIILNASQYGCDALIIHSTEDPVHVSLDTTQAEVSELSSKFQSLAGMFGSSDRQYTLVRILRKLWDHVVQPIIQSLEKSKIPPRSRIWWCPTAEFTLLPIHAAGPYEENKDNLSDIYISSYTPTLATLIRARKQVSRDPSLQHFVAIGQANPDRGKGLRCVAPELAIVAKRVEPVVSSFTSLEDSDATVQGALDALNHNQWLHLACHGMPNRQQPFESSFAMRDGPLMIKDIIRSNWENSEFAFLSACHTTVGDEKSPDESIHLAAAMQFCGFRSVIGSMWSVDDEVARQVASAFYPQAADWWRCGCGHYPSALNIEIVDCEVVVEMFEAQRWSSICDRG
ncbi:TPR-like protein [Suillus subluteus]|nr:TPR-like protein [Suillus subluteus]